MEFIGPRFVRLAACGLLYLGAVIAPCRTQASMPGFEKVSQVCVLEGFLIGSPTGYMRLKYLDKVDWTKFEGKTVRYKWRFGRGVDVLLVPPSVVAPCDPALVAAALPRALAQRAENEFVLEKKYETGLAEIERAIALAPQNCDFAATHVFMLQQLEKRNEADAESKRVASMACSRVLYQQKLRLLRQGIVLRLQ